MTLLSKLNRLPPIVCRLLAKKDGRLMSDCELMAATKWSKVKLRRIYRSTSWSHVSIQDADTFLAACGLSWSTQRRQRWLLQLAGGDIMKMRHIQNCKSATHVFMLNSIKRRAVSLLAKQP